MSSQASLDKQYVNYVIQPNYDTSYNSTEDSTVIVQASTKQVDTRVIKDSTKNKHNIKFIVEPNDGFALDTYLRIVLPRVKITMNHSNPDVGRVLEADFMTAMNNFSHIALKNFGLLNLARGVKCSLNGTDLRSDGQFVPEIMNFLSAHGGMYDHLSNGLMLGGVDKYQTYGVYGDTLPVIECKGISSAKVYLTRQDGHQNPFFGSIGGQSPSAGLRRPVVSFAGSTTNSVSFFIEGLEMPIPLSVFSVSNKEERRALAGVHRLELSVDLHHSAARLFSITDLASSATVIGSDEISSFTLELEDEAELHYKVLSLPDHELEYQKTNDNFPKSYIIPYTSINHLYDKEVICDAGNIETVRATTRRLQSVPSKLYICLVKKRNKGLTTINTIPAFTPFVGARVKNLSIHFNGAYTHFNDPRIIADLTLRNGVKNLTRHELLYTAGTSHVICIDVMRDLSSTYNLLAGQSAAGMEVNITMDVEDLAGVGAAEQETYQMYVFEETTRMLTYEKGTFRVNDYLSNVDYSAFSPAMFADSSKYLSAGSSIMYGSGFWDSVKNAFGSVVRNLPAVIGAVRDGVNVYRSLRGGATLTAPHGSTIIGGTVNSKKPAKKSTKSIGGASVDKIDYF